MANTRQNRSKKRQAPERSRAPLVLIVMIALSALLFWLSVATPEANTMVGSLQGVLRGLTGSFTWLLPVLLLWLGVYQLYARKKGTYSALSVVGSVLLALGLLACMTMCLILVWSNIERIDTTYFINIAQNKLQERKALRAKLEVERERLLSPYELRRKAEEIGMKEPKPGQVRRMEAH